MKQESVILEAVNIGKTFGDVRALDTISLKLRAFTVHALLGENGAGKSTLVKCLMGYYRPDSGQILFNQKEEIIESPQRATRLGLGMVYQHFTLIPNMTIAENIVLSRADLPAVIDWDAEIKILQEKMAQMPFQFELRRLVRDLSVGEKQKVEITKQLLLDTKVLILDEPTSVLTPTEADEVLGKIHQLTQQQQLTVLMITHKFREVMKFADHVTVLRKGQFIGSAPVEDVNPQILSDMMVGGESLSKPPQRETLSDSKIKLNIDKLTVHNDQDLPVIQQLDLKVAQGEIVGIAGVSGNGQKQLVEVLSGQRSPQSGEIQAHGQNFLPHQNSIRQHKFFCLPEEPLKNACVGSLSVADNIVLHKFNEAPFAKWGLLRRGAIRRRAMELIQQYRVRTSGPDQPIAALSGGNVQRVVLARELAQDVSILVVSNPCFGLDFKAVADIRAQLLQARNRGAAILLLSEDLDEILEMSDRFYVISGGKLVHHTTPAQANMNTIGQYMAGH
ncbi:MAG: ABC transporter ATP-binding protein [Cellvibrionaceae bacterium]|nr:ABC transporter ATP-binding protein [Cellvibrionaceae bacterium]